MTTIYVTKFALTDGPFKVEAELQYGGTYASWRANDFPQAALGKDFWLTPEEALADCDRRRQAKLKSIEKQKAKLEKMQFTIEEGQ